MCYNCGCGLVDDPMGQGHALSEPNGKSITNHTFSELAKKWNISDKDAKELVYSLLLGQNKDQAKEHEMEHLYEEAGKSQGMTTEEAKEEAKKLLQKVLSK